MKTIYLSMVMTIAVVVLFTTGFAGASGTDDRIETAAQNSYVFKTYLKDDHIGVHALDGVVTLTGAVNDGDHKSMAENTVASLPDVIKVDNQIQVKDQHSAGEDSWLSVKIKSALLFHRNVSAVRTKVYVKDGVATLQGDADSEAQKELTAEYASDVDGVKAVKNEMAVVKNPNPPNEPMNEKIDDASITGQVKMTLLAHRSTSSISTKVTTREGVVTLTGKAKNPAEKDLVTKLVSDIDGVTSVVNNMDVQ